jgi:HTH-type transcriptional regulator / antitoxin HigA
MEGVNMMLKIRTRKTGPLPTALDALVRLMPPMAIRDDIHHANTIEMIDRLMQIENLTPGQADYLETLVELVEAYESKRQAFDLSKISGLRMLKHVLEQSSMSASDLARLLKVHASMGSKILKGERQLTWEHAKVLAAEFKVAPVLFMDPD